MVCAFAVCFVEYVSVRGLLRGFRHGSRLWGLLKTDRDRDRYRGPRPTTRSKPRSHHLGWLRGLLHGFGTIRGFEVFRKWTATATATATATVNREPRPLKISTAFRTMVSTPFHLVRAAARRRRRRRRRWVGVIKSESKSCFYGAENLAASSLWVGASR